MAPPKLVELEHDKELRELVSSWDFDAGKRFQDKVLSSLNSSVHHPSSSPRGSFSLLAVFRRLTFRLTVETVSLALHACLGGSPAGFHVSYVQDRHFRFVVSCKQVGFMVCNLKRFITDHFDVYFHLWRDGGDSWVREERRWLREEAQSWNEVSYRKKKKTTTHKKKVTFRNPVVQESPNKSKCGEDDQHTKVIKFGSFKCRIPIQHFSSTSSKENISAQDRSTTSFLDNIHGTSSCRKREVEDDIQIKRVFGNCKRDLCINSMVGRMPNRAKHAPPSEFTGTTS